MWTDLYHCESEFLTMPAAEIGTKDCARVTNDRAHTAFCTTQRDPAHVPGFHNVCNMIIIGIIVRFLKNSLFIFRICSPLL